MAYAAVVSLFTGTKTRAAKKSKKKQSGYWSGS